MHAGNAVTDTLQTCNPHSRLTVTIACKMDFHFYPLDTQMCNIQMQSCKWYFKRHIKTSYEIATGKVYFVCNFQMLIPPVL